MRRWANPIAFVVLLAAIAFAGWYSVRDSTPKRRGDGLADGSAVDVISQPCAGQAPPEATTLNIGDAALWFRSFPHTVATLDGKPVFVLTRNADGTIAPDLALFVDGKPAARLQGVTLNDNLGQLTLKQTGGSEIIVSTPDGAVIVQIDYLNAHSLRVTGHLTFGRHDLVAPTNSFAQDGRNLGNTCLGGDHAVDFAF